MLELDGIIEAGGSGTIRVRPQAVLSDTKSDAANALPVPPLSPRIKSDPAAGVMIAEYLSSNGEKQIQVPSQTVVAYLRSGLTASGTPVKGEQGAVEA